MTLGAGTKLGPYEVVGPIGAGGMGEVYRARDTKLGREVALKVLPEAFASDPERMARFEREAKVLASLNHPNIATIHGFEESSGVHALVMELVEGQTLAERIATTSRGAVTLAPAGIERSTTVDPRSPRSREHASRGDHGRGGAIPVDEALPIAKQICEGLEYAHERGIIHRDLKPANVKITPDGVVKILDFGLAKALEAETAVSDVSSSPTMSRLATQAGIILGTAAYMAPEQAKGKAVDRRVDIWGFGCLLYEMLSGQKAFEGETASDVLAAVLKEEPDWNGLPAETPASIHKLIRRCLSKDPKQRLRDIGDVRIALDETISDAAGVTPADATLIPISVWRRALPWALAAATIGILVLAVVTIRLWLQPKIQQPVIRFSVVPPESAKFDSSNGVMSLSPDGRLLAFVAGNSAGGYQLWVRPLDTLAAKPLQGTEGASWPFWSPDGKYLGFYAAGDLKKVAVSGGPAQALCPASALSASWKTAGASWNQAGTILFSSDGSLYRVPDAGGKPSLVASPNSAEGEVAYAEPQFLPDGQHFLFGIKILNAVPYAAVGSLDSKQIQRFAGVGSEAIYAAPGYLLYAQGDELLARAFDVKHLRFIGEAVPVGGDAQGGISASQNGILAYQPGAGSGQDQVVWFDRKGEKIGTVGQPGVYEAPAISPDGRKAAVALVQPDVGAGDIWVYDLRRGSVSRLTFSGNNIDPVWSSDGSRILFSSSRNGPMGIYSKTADGLGATEVVFQPSRQPMWVDSVSPDGRYATCFSSAPTASVWVLPLLGGRKPDPFVQGSSFAASRSRVSPNSRYVAYNSDETGREEVYVQTFPQHSGKWQVSTSGGSDPMWRSDGRELFYLAPNDEVMTVSINTDSAAFEASAPHPLFQARLVDWVMRDRYAVSPDGQRFLMLAPAGESKSSPIHVVANWPELLRGTDK